LGKVPDLLLCSSQEVYPTDGCENLLFALKSSLIDGTEEDETLQRLTVAEALDYANANMHAAIDMAPAEVFQDEMFTYAIATIMTHINITKVSLSPLDPLNSDPTTTSTNVAEMFIKKSYESTGWLPLIPRNSDMDMHPTEGFRALVTLLTTPPEALMQFHAQLPNLDEITPVVKSLQGDDMEFAGRLGRGGFSDVLYFSNKTHQGSESYKKIEAVVKVRRSSNCPDVRTGLAREINTLLELNSSQCAGVPTLLYPTSQQSVDDLKCEPKFFVTQ
jgi:hypothetical protein